MHLHRRSLIAALLLAGPLLAGAGGAGAHELTITLLSTGLAGGPNAGMGEWGFSALVEADGRSFLYDTGGRPHLVLGNAAALGIDLAKADTVILSHFHPDHVGGLMTLRTALAPAHPTALARAEVAEGIFAPRYREGDRDLNPMTEIRAGCCQSNANRSPHDAARSLSASA